MKTRMVECREHGDPYWTFWGYVKSDGAAHEAQWKLRRQGLDVRVVEPEEVY